MWARSASNSAIAAIVRRPCTTAAAGCCALTRHVRRLYCYKPLAYEAVTTTSVDGPLPLARRRLDDAVHALADPVPQWVDGACRWHPALYGRLRVALARSATARLPAAQS